MFIWVSFHKKHCSTVGRVCNPFVTMDSQDLDKITIMSVSISTSVFCRLPGVCAPATFTAESLSNGLIPDNSTGSGYPKDLFGPECLQRKL